MSWRKVAEVTRLSFDQGGQLERRRLHLREISPDVDAPLETVGQDLRTARQRKGEDLASVSHSLKIRKDYLNALEESDFELLPGRAYAVGFVHSYAKYLGLEAPSLVERYKTEIAGLDEVEEKEVCLAPEAENKYPQGTIGFVALLLACIAYGGYYLQSSANQMLTERETAIPDRLEAVVAEQTPAPAPVAAPAMPQSCSSLNPQRRQVALIRSLQATGLADGELGTTDSPSRWLQRCIG